MDNHEEEKLPLMFQHRTIVPTMMTNDELKEAIEWVFDRCSYRKRFGRYGYTEYSEDVLQVMRDHLKKLTAIQASRAASIFCKNPPEKCSAE